MSLATHGERLAALRHRLGELGLDGFILPRTDAHNNEFIAASEERLDWLTGFSGSAGTAVILADRAALMVDGRYSVQARAEVDTDAYTVIDDPAESLAGWLETQVSAEQRLGVDPWLHSRNALAKIDAAAERVGASVVRLSTNPVAELWTDRPAPPAAPVWPHPLEFAGKPAARKLSDMAAQVSENGADALILTLPEDIAWLLNVRGDDVAYTPLPLSFAVLNADASLDWFIDLAKLTREVRADLPQGVRTLEPAAFLSNIGFQARRGRRFLIDPDRCPAAVTERIAAEEGRTIDAEDPILAAKARKTGAELGGSRHAHRRDGVALVTFLAWLERAVAHGHRITEAAAATELWECRRRQERLHSPSFGTISAADGHGAIVHYAVSEETDRVITPQSIYLCDSGAQYLDGTTDVTRTWSFAEPPAAIRRTATRVLKGHIAVAQAVFPEGTAGAQIDALARQHLWAAGQDYAHGTGHGVGAFLGVHEAPARLGKTAQRGLEAGMILSDEPGFYAPEQFGVRLENLLAVRRLTSDELPEEADGTKTWLGFETLTCAPFDRKLIEPGLLTAAERAWIDAYHADVYAQLEAHLPDQATTDWLHGMTKPL